MRQNLQKIGFTLILNSFHCVFTKQGLEHEVIHDLQTLFKQTEWLSGCLSRKAQNTTDLRPTLKIIRLSAKHFDLIVYDLIKQLLISFRTLVIGIFRIQFDVNCLLILLCHISRHTFCEQVLNPRFCGVHCDRRSTLFLVLCSASSVCFLIELLLLNIKLDIALSGGLIQYILNQLRHLSFSRTGFG